MAPTPQEPPEGGAEEDESGSQGWIDPDDRLWRHPSEVAGGSGAPTAPVGPVRPVQRDSHRARIMYLVGAVAAAAAVLWTGILISQDSTRPETARISDASSDAPLTTLAGPASAIPDVADAAGESMVQLRAVTDHGTVTLAGVAVAEGGQVATVAGALAGLRSLDMVGPDGRLLHATVEGIDHQSDIALVEVPDDLPVPQFADDVSLDSGSSDWILNIAPASGGNVTLHCAAGSVTAVGQAIATGPASGMPAITSSASGTTEEAGDLLLNSTGEVLGIYYGGPATTPVTTAATTTTTTAVPAPTFLPTQLVLGVADDLRSSEKVHQGWLGIAGTDMAGQPGVAVAKVLPGSPAAGRLYAGDVIAALDSVPIRSMADLRGRLYVLNPSTRVSLSVQRGGSDIVVGVTLSSSP